MNRALHSEGVHTGLGESRFTEVGSHSWHHSVFLLGMMNWKVCHDSVLVCEVNLTGGLISEVYWKNKACTGGVDAGRTGLSKTVCERHL